MLHQHSLGLAPPAEPGEEWRRCHTWPWLWASSEGRIATEARKSGHWAGPPRIARLGIGKRGYRTLGGRVRAAPLVADAWLGPKEPGPHVHVCHINGNRSDDRPANLRYGTPRQNYEDAVAHGTRAQHFDDPTVIGLLLTMRGGETDAAAARRLGTSPQHISAIRSGRIWRHVAPCLPRRAAWRAIQQQRKSATTSPRSGQRRKEH